MVYFSCFAYTFCVYWGIIASKYSLTPGWKNMIWSYGKNKHCHCHCHARHPQQYFFMSRQCPVFLWHCSVQFSVNLSFCACTNCEVMSTWNGPQPLNWNNVAFVSLLQHNNPVLPLVWRCMACNLVTGHAGVWRLDLNTASKCSVFNQIFTDYLQLWRGS